jgi:hypothetical protein
MTHPTAASVRWYTDRLNAFISWTVVGTSIEDDVDEGYFALRLRNPETGEDALIWFYSDDEGNNPGSFDIQRGEIP